MVFAFPNNFEFLIKTIKESYYTDGIAFVIAFIGIFVSIKGRKNHKKLFIFLPYFIAYVILKILFYCEDLIYYELNYKEWHQIQICADSIFTLFEFGIFSIYLNRILNSLIYKRILKIVSILFYVISIMILIIDYKSNNNFSLQTNQKLFNVQAISLLIPCVFYFLELFKCHPSLNLLNEPSYWIITGLTFFMLCTLPFSMFMTHILKSNPKLFYNLFSIFLIFYIILFSMIIRAYLCKSEQITSI